MVFSITLSSFLYLITSRPIIPGFNVRIIVRKKGVDKVYKGLSSAVMRGFDEAQGRLLLCMDADLQVSYPTPPHSVMYLLLFF